MNGGNGVQYGNGDVAVWGGAGEGGQAGTSSNMATIGQEIVLFNCICTSCTRSRRCRRRRGEQNMNDGNGVQGDNGDIAVWGGAVSNAVMVM